MNPGDFSFLADENIHPKVIEFLNNPILVDIFRMGTLYMLIPIFIDLLFIVILRAVYVRKSP